MREKEPFSEARNLKIFIIVLCCLPVIGIISYLFFPSTPNVASVDLFPIEYNDNIKINEFLEFAKNEGGEIPDEYFFAVNSLVGDVKKTYSILPKLITNGKYIYMINPFNSIEKYSIGVEVLRFSYDNTHFEGDEITKNIAAPVDLALIPKVQDGNYLGVMNISIEYVDRFVFTYNYEELKVKDGTNDKFKPLKIEGFDLDLAESSFTQRLVKTQFSACKLNYTNDSVVSDKDITIISRSTPSGLKNQTFITDNDVLYKSVYSDEKQLEKGAYYKINLETGIMKFKSFECSILNEEVKAKASEENPETFPSFNVSFRITYRYDKESYLS